MNSEQLAGIAKLVEGPGNCGEHRDAIRDLLAELTQTNLQVSELRKAVEEMVNLHGTEPGQLAYKIMTQRPGVSVKPDHEHKWESNLSMFNPLLRCSCGEEKEDPSAQDIRSPR